MEFQTDGGADGGAGPGSAADMLGGSAGAGGGGTGGGGDTGGAGAGAGDNGGGQGGGEGWFTALGLSTDPAGENAASNHDYVASKGWKSVNDLVTSYRQAETALRNGDRVAIPGENATPEERAAFHRAIGVPEDVKGYALEAPVGADGKPVQLNSALIDRLSAKALEAGMPAGAFKAVLGDFIRAQVEERAGFEQQGLESARAWVAKQGADGDAKLAAIDRAAKAFNLSARDLNELRNLWGADKAMGMLSRAGLGIREDTMIEGGRNTFGLSGAEAQAQIDQLRSDPKWVAKALVPGSPEAQQYKRLLGMVGEAANRAAAEY